jgi:hypothetical protein
MVHAYVVVARARNERCGTPKQGAAMEKPGLAQQSNKGLSNRTDHPTHQTGSCEEHISERTDVLHQNLRRPMMLDVCGQCNVSKKSGGIETSPNES